MFRRMQPMLDGELLRSGLQLRSHLDVLYGYARLKESSRDNRVFNLIGVNSAGTITSEICV